MNKKDQRWSFLMERKIQMRNDGENERRKLKAQQALKMRKAENFDVTLDQAKNLGIFKKTSKSNYF